MFPLSGSFAWHLIQFLCSFDAFNCEDEDPIVRGQSLVWNTYAPSVCNDKVYPAGCMCNACHTTHMAGYHNYSTDEIAEAFFVTSFVSRFVFAAVVCSGLIRAQGMAIYVAYMKLSSASRCAQQHTPTGEEWTDPGDANKTRHVGAGPVETYRSTITWMCN